MSITFGRPLVKGNKLTIEENYTIIFRKINNLLSLEPFTYLDTCHGNNTFTPCYAVGRDYEKL